MASRETSGGAEGGERNSSTKLGVIQREIVLMAGGPAECERDSMTGRARSL